MTKCEKIFPTYIADKALLFQKQNSKKRATDMTYVSKKKYKLP